MNVRKENLELNKVYEQLFPERKFWRYPWMRAEDLMNRDNLNVAVIGEDVALRVLCIILFEISFPKGKGGNRNRCKAKARKRLQEIIAPKAIKPWSGWQIKKVTRMVHNLKTVEEIRAALNS